ncbi:MAG TPA: hypothetical protein ENN99_08210 [Chloroflexi bacterium]|nr:hypothetical protein [Chloroflexota bacterium]
MLRRRLKDQFSNRTFVLLATVVLVLLLGWLTEYHYRQISLLDYLGLAEFRGRSLLDIWLGISMQQATGSLLGTLKLILTLLPAALFNALPVLVALAVTAWLATHFIHTLYETQDRKEAFGFLRQNIFGMTELRPIMIVKEGDIFVGKGSLYDRIGGRGLFIVYNDSAVVIEKGGRLVRVMGTSLSFLKRFERVWEVVDLRVQRWPFLVSGMTKEGIPVECVADITFKIDDRYLDEDGNVQVKQPVKARYPEDMDKEIAAELDQGGIGEPLPHTEEAVFNAATALWVRIHQPDHEEQLRKWTGRVIITQLEGDLRTILANYRLDWLLRPYPTGSQHPREEIRELLEAKLQNAFPPGNPVGARILRVDLGEIKVKDEIAQQWVEAWQAGWEQRTAESKAEGEAELIWLEAAQVQAQAEMVITLAEAIRPLVNSEGELSSYTLAMRFIETLRWMSYNPWTRNFLPPEAMRSLNELEKLLPGGEGTT